MAPEGAAKERQSTERQVGTVKRFPMPRPGLVLGLIAVVLALGGTAVAGIPPGDPLKLGMFQDDSRDRLAGTGVIQHAGASS